MATTLANGTAVHDAAPSLQGLSGAAAATARPDLERDVGMLVRFPRTLAISEPFNLDRVDEIRLAAGGRPGTVTNAFEPDARADRRLPGPGCRRGRCERHHHLIPMA